MCAAAKMSKTQQLKERWEEGELDCGSITPEFIEGAQSSRARYAGRAYRNRLL